MERNEAFALGNLHPSMIPPVNMMTRELERFEHTVNGRKMTFRPFEGFRHPARQYHLFAIGKVTKARPWQSAHQYGLAVDFACREIEKSGAVSGWYWPDLADWEHLKKVAVRAGLDIPISWDRGHVEHPLFRKIAAIL